MSSIIESERKDIADLFQHNPIRIDTAEGSNTNECEVRLMAEMGWANVMQ